VAHCVAALLLGGHALVIAADEDYFPLSSYPMFSYLDREHTWIELRAVTDRGEERISPKFHPLGDRALQAIQALRDDDYSIVTLARVRLAPRERDRRVQAAMHDLRQVYEKAQSTRVREMRLYRCKGEGACDLLVEGQ